MMLDHSAGVLIVSMLPPVRASENPASNSRPSNSPPLLSVTELPKIIEMCGGMPEGGFMLMSVTPPRIPTTPTGVVIETPSGVLLVAAPMNRRTPLVRVAATCAVPASGL
jgi:hypothetical protein